LGRREAFGHIPTMLITNEEDTDEDRLERHVDALLTEAEDNGILDAIQGPLENGDSVSIFGYVGTARVVVDYYVDDPAEPTENVSDDESEIVDSYTVSCLYGHYRGDEDAVEPYEVHGIDYQIIN
jgi:hypothetical protein